MTWWVADLGELCPLTAILKAGRSIVGAHEAADFRRLRMIDENAVSARYATIKDGLGERGRSLLVVTGEGRLELRRNGHH